MVIFSHRRKTDSGINDLLIVSFLTLGGLFPPTHLCKLTHTDANNCISLFLCMCLDTLLVLHRYSPSSLKAGTLSNSNVPAVRHSDSIIH